MSVARDARAPAAATERAYVAVAADVDNLDPRHGALGRFVLQPLVEAPNRDRPPLQDLGSLQRTSC
jgi:hypothetical protein